MNINLNLSHLNPEQQSAITCPLNQSCLVVAGAGSGKTSVLTNRIAYLIKSGVSPESILAVTFTNKAAKEMQHRLFGLGIPTHRLWMGTFHGLGYKIIKEHYQELGLPDASYVLDTQDQKAYLKKIIKAIGEDPKALNIEDILDSINGWKERGWRVKDVKKGDTTYYKLYEENAQKDGALDFAELLIGSYELLQKPHLKKYYSEKFKYILVDEFQDTNLLQYSWIQSLAAVHQNVFVVGDFDQSIYSFRGAYPQNLFRIVSDYPGLMEVKLEQNYRSTATILDAANNIIKNNSKRQAKNLWTSHKSNQKIIYKNAYNDFDEATFVCDEIRMMARQGIPYKDMTILYRTNALSRNYEKMFMSRNIPFTIYGGLRFFERQEIKNAIGFLRLALDQKDNLAFSRIVNVPARGIGDASINKLEILDQKKNIGLFNCIPLLDAKTGNKFSKFESQMELLISGVKGLKIAEQIKFIVEHCGLLDYYEEKSETERNDNLYELIASGLVFEKENPGATIQDFLNQCQLDGDFDKIQQNKHMNLDTVQMMTIHSAKGLEFPIVFIVGLNEQIFPHARTIGNQDDVEEERRLMYVATTRAKQKLYLLSSENRFFQGFSQEVPPSRFIYEIPDNLIQKVF